MHPVASESTWANVFSVWLYLHSLTISLQFLRYWSIKSNVCSGLKITNDGIYRMVIQEFLRINWYLCCRMIFNKYSRTVGLGSIAERSLPTISGIVHSPLLPSTLVRVIMFSNRSTTATTGGLLPANKNSDRMFKKKLFKASRKPLYCALDSLKIV